VLAVSYAAPCSAWATYRLCDVVDDDGAVGIPVVHGRERLVALLAGCVPYLKLYGCVLVEGDGLGEEGGADGGFPVVVELVLDEAQDER
jgi:hypothetical protein